MKDKLSIWWKFCLLTLLLVLAPPEIMAQGLTIKGQVLDSNNEPIMGTLPTEPSQTSMVISVSRSQAKEKQSLLPTSAIRLRN